MSAMLQKSRVIILVKALPQRSTKHGETVCCAGMTVEGEWKRLYPIRFRRLSGESSFKRWDWVEFGYRRPIHDSRKESCHVFEDTIRVDGQLQLSRRGRLLEPFVMPSVKSAADRGKSLALIRPRNTRFWFKPKSVKAIELEREKLAAAAAANFQTSMFDKDLAALEPTPYDFRFDFEDENGKHTYRNGDWEAHVMFFKERNRTSEKQALDWMDQVFNEEYPRKGMLFAIGNMASRPNTWQLLGVLRVDEPQQPSLAL